MNKRIELMSIGRKGRRLFVVDIENALSSSEVTEGGCSAVRRWSESALGFGGDDLAVVGISHPANTFGAAAWDGARVVMRRGHDGADEALIDVLRNEGVEKRFDEIVIISGDHAFEAELVRLRSLGVKAVVVSRAAGLSRRLARSASVIRLQPSLLAA